MGDGVRILLLEAGGGGGGEGKNSQALGGALLCSGWLGQETMAVWQLSEVQQVCRTGQFSPILCRLES